MSFSIDGLPYSRMVLCNLVLDSFTGSFYESNFNRTFKIVHFSFCISLEACSKSQLDQFFTVCTGDMLNWTNIQIQWYFLLFSLSIIVIVLNDLSIFFFRNCKISNKMILYSFQLFAQNKNCQTVWAIKSIFISINIGKSINLLWYFVIMWE